MAEAGYYGLRHPNRNAQAAGYAHQWAYSTRQGRSVDLVVVHSAESIPDMNGPDNGAENVSRYMTTTNRSVSWHATSDSDSVVWNCPAEWTCFHAGSGWNRRAWGIEQAYRAGDFAKLPDEFRAATIDNTAQAVAVACGRYGIPPVFIDRGQIDAGRRGITAHGTGNGVAGLQPGNVRSDPGWTVDDWRLFISRVTAYVDASAVGLGSKGPAVEAAQTDLNGRASAGLVVDGEFGPKTHAAVLVDQAARGGSASGVWSRLSVPFRLPSGVTVDPPGSDDVDTPKLDRALTLLEQAEARVAKARRLLSG